jgi:hypothetical protein
VNVTKRIERSVDIVSANDPNTNELLEGSRHRFEQEAAFRSAAETDLQGTLRNAGLPDELLSRFVVSDTDQSGNAPMGLRSERKQIWICEIEGDTKRCWCTNCDYP